MSSLPIPHRKAAAPGGVRYLGAIIGIGYGIARLLDEQHFTFTTTDIVAALSGMMVVAGFLGAVSIGCMNQIFSTLSDGLFSDYLKEEGVFDQFLAWPQIILLIQMSYLVLCAAGVLFVCTTSQNFGRTIVLCELSTLTLYLTTKTWSLLDLLRILAWHRQDYARILREEISLAKQ